MKLLVKDILYNLQMKNKKISYNSALNQSQIIQRTPWIPKNQLHQNAGTLAQNRNHLHSWCRNILLSFQQEKKKWKMM